MGTARSNPIARSYPIALSPLFRLQSKRKLAGLLGVPLKDLLFLLDLGDNYRTWPLPQRRRDVLIGAKALKKRDIQQPKPILAAVHKRLAVLMGRIQKPEFVYSATKQRSYVDNAKVHRNPHGALKVDIRSFYPSIKAKSVRNFFEFQLECSADVAHVLSRICCSGGTLPTGSAVSPVLSYFACSRMFQTIADMASAHGLAFTLYVDDMVFSGEKASKEFLNLVLKELARHGFVGHKISHFQASDTKVVTGVAVSPTGIDIPYKRQKRIRLFEEAFWKATDPDDIRALGATLLGQFREAERLQHGSRLRALPIQQRLDTLAPATKPVQKRAKRGVPLHRSRKLFSALRSSVDKGKAEAALAEEPSETEAAT